MTQFGVESKVNACMVKKNNRKWPGCRDMMSTEQLESILLTRLSDETFRGLMNFEKATIPGTPINEIEKALVS